MDTECYIMVESLCGWVTLNLDDMRRVEAERMEILRRPRTRAMLTTLFIAMLLAGFCGFFLSIPPVVGVHRFEKQKLLHSINGVFVDRRGHLYYGSDYYRTIQVYDNYGSFLYGLGFGASVTRGSHYAFFMDEQDYVHVCTVTRNGGKAHKFLYGKLIDSISFEDHDTADAVYSIYQGMAMRYESNTYNDSEGNEYIVTKDSKVEISDATGTHLRTVKPQTPIWPFHAIVFWLMAAAGKLGVFALHWELF